MRVRLSLLTLFLLIGLVCSIVSHVWMSWRLEHLRRENQRQAVELGQLVIRDPDKAYLRQIASPSPGVLKYRVYLPPNRRYALRRATSWFGSGFTRTEPWAEVLKPGESGEFLITVGLSDFQGDLSYRVRGPGTLNVGGEMRGGGQLMQRSYPSPEHQRQRELDLDGPIELLRLTAAIPYERRRADEGILFWISPLTDKELVTVGEPGPTRLFDTSPVAAVAADKEAAVEIELLGGMTRFSRGRLAGVSFQYCPVIDEELQVLRKVRSLERLFIYRTQVTDRALDHVTHLGELRDLTIGHSHLTDNGLSKLSSLTQLTSLSVPRSVISDAGLQHLKGMEKLRSLYLRSNVISDDGLAQLAGLVKLERLGLSQTKISGPGLAHLAAMQELIELDLTDTQVGDEGCEHLARLERLDFLSLSGTRVTDAGLHHLGRLRRLRTLRLVGCDITDTGLRSLSSLVNLHRLFLDDTDVTANGLKHLVEIPRLLSLRLEGTQLTDDALPSLLSMTSLDHLYIANTGVSDEAAYVLLEKIPGLQIHRLDRQQRAAVRRFETMGASYRHDDKNVTQLVLKGSNMTNVDLRLLSELSWLHTLTISHTQLTDLALEDVARLPRLKVLKLSGMLIDDAWLERLAILELPIQELLLSDLPITDDGLRHLAALPNLTRLEISDSQISDEGLQHLANRPELDVYLTRTRVSDAGVQELRKTVRWVEAK